MHALDTNDKVLVLAENGDNQEAHRRFSTWLHLYVTPIARSDQHPLFRAFSDVGKETLDWHVPTNRKGVHWRYLETIANYIQAGYGLIAEDQARRPLYTGLEVDLPLRHIYPHLSYFRDHISPVPVWGTDYCWTVRHRSGYYLSSLTTHPYRSLLKYPEMVYLYISRYNPCTNAGKFADVWHVQGVIDALTDLVPEIVLVGKELGAYPYIFVLLPYLSNRSSHQNTSLITNSVSLVSAMSGNFKAIITDNPAVYEVADNRGYAAYLRTPPTAPDPPTGPLARDIIYRRFLTYDPTKHKEGKPQSFWLDHRGNWADPHFKVKFIKQPAPGPRTSAWVDLVSKEVRLWEAARPEKFSSIEDLLQKLQNITLSW